MAKMTDKNTKAQILSAYNSALQEIENLQSSIHDPAAQVKAKKEAEILTNAEQTVGQSVEAQIAELQQTMSKVLINLSGSFSSKVEEYATVEEAIKLKKAELKEIHDIEAKAYSLAALVNTHKELEDQFNLNAEQRRVELQEELNKIKIEIAETKANFAKEVADEKNRLELERKREEEEYEYDFKRRKQKREDELNDHITSKHKALNEQVNKTNKEIEERLESVQEREENLSKRESNIEVLEAEVAALPDKIKAIREEIEAEVKAQFARNEAIKENSIKKHYESDKKILENQIELLTSQLASEQQKSADLAAKLDKAYEKIQDVAIATTQRPVVEYRNQGNESK